MRGAASTIPQDKNPGVIIAEGKEEVSDDEEYTLVSNTYGGIMPETNSALHNSCTDRVTVDTTKKETKREIKDEIVDPGLEEKAVEEQGYYQERNQERNESDAVGPVLEEKAAEEQFFCRARGS